MFWNTDFLDVHKTYLFMYSFNWFWNFTWAKINKEAFDHCVNGAGGSSVSEASNSRMFQSKFN